MNHFVNVTFQIPEQAAEQWKAACETMIKHHSTDTLGARPIKLEEVGTDEMPDRCEKTPDFFIDESTPKKGDVTHSGGGLNLETHGLNTSSPGEASAT